jgi:hypothetical protein
VLAWLYDGVDRFLGFSMLLTRGIGMVRRLVLT